MNIIKRIYNRYRYIRIEKYIFLYEHRYIEYKRRPLLILQTSRGELTIEYEFIAKA